MIVIPLGIFNSALNIFLLFLVSKFPSSPLITNDLHLNPCLTLFAFSKNIYILFVPLFSISCILSFSYALSFILMIFFTSLCFMTSAMAFLFYFLSN